MANKAHVAKKYTIEYGDSHFNGAQRMVNRLLYNHIGSFNYSGEDVEYAEHIEVGREDLRDLVAHLKEFPQTINKYQSECDLHNYSAEEVVSLFEMWIVESDPSNSFIVVDWF